jgi:hypothetical protein
MSFLKRVFGRGCSHRFTWPRVSGNGQHYQICSVCGIAYEYDWKGMRRTGRVLASDGQSGIDFVQNRSPRTAH